MVQDGKLNEERMQELFFLSVIIRGGVDIKPSVNKICGAVPELISEIRKLRAWLEQFASIETAYQQYIDTSDGIDGKFMTLEQFAHSCVADMLD